MFQLKLGVSLSIPWALWKMGNPQKTAPARQGCSSLPGLRTHFLPRHLPNVLGMANLRKKTLQGMCTQLRPTLLHLGLHQCGVCLPSCFSCVPLFATLWIVAHQAPLSMEFSRQEYWLPCPPPGDLSDPRIKPTFLMSPALTGRFFTTSTSWEAQTLAKGNNRTHRPLPTNVTQPTQSGGKTGSGRIRLCRAQGTKGQKRQQPRTVP